MQADGRAVPWGAPSAAELWLPESLGIPERHRAPVLQQHNHHHSVATGPSPMAHPTPHTKPQLPTHRKATYTALQLCSCSLRESRAASSLAAPLAYLKHTSLPRRQQGCCVLVQAAGCSACQVGSRMCQTQLQCWEHREQQYQHWAALSSSTCRLLLLGEA